MYYTTALAKQAVAASNKAKHYTVDVFLRVLTLNKQQALELALSNAETLQFNMDVTYLQTGDVRVINIVDGYIDVALHYLAHTDGDINTVEEVTTDRRVMDIGVDDYL